MLSPKETPTPKTRNWKTYTRSVQLPTVLKILEMPDGTTTAIIQGKKRFELDDILYDEPYHVGKIIVKQEDTIKEDDQEYNAIGEAFKGDGLEDCKNIPATSRTRPDSP